jgi:glycosyltransferase involved in cell wall biosynthesis
MISLICPQIQFLPRVSKAIISFLFFSRSLLKKQRLAILSGHFSVLSCFLPLSIFTIHYCHSIPQFAFNRKSEYLKRHSILIKLILLIFINIYRYLYVRSLKNIDIIFVNSEYTKSKLKSIGFESEVLYPPINVGELQNSSDKGYYLSLGRLEKNKRIDQIIEAFKKMPDKKLIVTSGGSLQSKLIRMAGSAPNIQFTGWVDDISLAQLIKESTACIYIPREEDFGMSSVEAMSYGKPVIGVLEGGQSELLINMVNSVALSPNPSIDQICEAINALNSERALELRNSCHSFALKFKSQIFFERLQSLF